MTFILYYIGQGDGDILGVLRMPKELYDALQEEGVITIGGGYNGRYEFGPDVEVVTPCPCPFALDVVDESPTLIEVDRTGQDIMTVTTLLELVQFAQNHMGYDDGGFIQRAFIERLSPSDKEAVMAILRYPIQSYAGQGK